MQRGTFVWTIDDWAIDKRVPVWDGPGDLTLSGQPS
jgi:hypothetical protein